MSGSVDNNQKNDPKSCNRQPFLSEGGCDRGSVDIRQFDDFPFCESFDPTMPEIPPEIVDTPIELPVPPSCACFNIAYAMNLKYSKERKFAGKGSFSAKGDCCEGNYVTSLNLEIPCPVLGDGKSKKIKMKIGYGKGKGSASASYIITDKDSCTVEAKDVDFNLQLPCPVKDPGTRKVKIGLSYGAKFKGASAKVIKVDASKCEIEPLDPTFRLQIPCPVKKNTQNKLPKFAISYGKTFNSVSASFLKANSTSCTVEPLAPSVKLQIPCPIIGRDDKPPKIKITMGWGSRKSASGSFIKTDTSACTIEPKDVTLNLQIPCPVKKQNPEPKLKLGVKWGSSKTHESINFLKANSKSCTIETNSASFSLQIKCPIRHTRWHKRVGSFCYVQYRRRFIYANGVYGDFKSFDTSFIKVNEKSCVIETGRFDLDVPCPIKRENSQKPPKIKASIKWGSSAPSVSASYIEMRPESCAIEPKDVTLNLQIPCPVKKRNPEPKLKLGVKWGSSKSHESISFLKANSKSCTIETNSASFSLQIKCPIRHTQWHKKVGDYCYAQYRKRYVYADNTYGTYKSYQTSFIKVNEKSCTIETGRFDLDIPCPLPKKWEWKKIKLKKAVFGNNSPSGNLIRFYDCGLEMNTTTSFSINVPCPLTKNRLKIETSASTTSGSKGSLAVIKDSYTNESTCTRTIKIKATFPKGGGATFDSSVEVIKDLKYNASKHALQYRTFNLKTKAVSVWKDVFTAVGHKSDHICCNDV